MTLQENEFPTHYLINSYTHFVVRLFSYWIANHRDILKPIDHGVIKLNEDLKYTESSKTDIYHKTTCLCMYKTEVLKVKLQNQRSLNLVT